MYDLNENGHETDDLMATIRKSKEWGDRIPVGIIYRFYQPAKAEYKPVLTQPIELKAN